MRHTYRRALVTGASSGLGALFARELAQRGVELVLVARRVDRLEQLAAELAVPVQVLPADLRSDEGLAAVEERLRDSGAPVDLLVNNAGVGTTGAFADRPLAEKLATISLNCTAMLRLTHAALPQMLAREYGGILNVSSLAAFTPSARAATYGATKAFVTAFSENLSREVRGRNVHVTALMPGPSPTELTDTRMKITVPRIAWQKPEPIVTRGLAAVEKGKTFCTPSRALAAFTPVMMRMPRSLSRVLGDRMFRDIGEAGEAGEGGDAAAIG